MTCHCSRFLAPLLTMADVRERCETLPADFARMLQPIAELPEHWAQLLRCCECGTQWCREYPFAEEQGGGPACYFTVAPVSTAAWLAGHEPLTPRLRDAQEDADFMALLGDEIGPETCAAEGCTSLRIADSVCCRLHHAQAVRHLRETGE